MKTEHDSGQSPTVILYFAVNKMPNVYVLSGNCSLTSTEKCLIRLRKYLLTLCRRKCVLVVFT